jgi:hypothetical protein
VAVVLGVVAWVLAVGLVAQVASQFAGEIARA